MLAREANKGICVIRDRKCRLVGVIGAGESVRDGQREKETAG